MEALLPAAVRASGYRRAAPNNPRGCPHVCDEVGAQRSVCYYKPTCSSALLARSRQNPAAVVVAAVSSRKCANGERRTAKFRGTPAVFCIF